MDLKAYTMDVNTNGKDLNAYTLDVNSYTMDLSASAMDRVVLQEMQEDNHAAEQLTRMHPNTQHEHTDTHTCTRNRQRRARTHARPPTRM